MTTKCFMRIIAVLACLLCKRAECVLGRLARNALATRMNQQVIAPRVFHAVSMQRDEAQQAQLPGKIIRAASAAELQEIAQALDGDGKKRFAFSYMLRKKMSRLESAHLAKEELVRLARGVDAAEYAHARAVRSALLAQVIAHERPDFVAIPSMSGGHIPMHLLEPWKTLSALSYDLAPPEEVDEGFDILARKRSKFVYEAHVADVWKCSRPGLQYTSSCRSFGPQKSDAFEPARASREMQPKIHIVNVRQVQGGSPSARDIERIEQWFAPEGGVALLSGGMMYRDNIQALQDAGYVDLTTDHPDKLFCKVFNKPGCLNCAVVCHVSAASRGGQDEGRVRPEDLPSIARFVIVHDETVPIAASILPPGFFGATLNLF